MHFRPFSGSFIPFFRISKPDFKPFNPCLRPHKHKERVWQNFATPSLQYSLLKFSKWFKYGLKAQKLQKQHALKGQKLLAQGIALGIIAINKAPCKGKSFVNCLILLKLLPLQGDKLASMITQGAALG